MKEAAKRLLNAAADLYRRYPARATSVVIAAIVGGLGAAGVTVDAASVKDIVVPVLPILIGGELIHRRVSPAKRGR